MKKRIFTLLSLLFLLAGSGYGQDCTLSPLTQTCTFDNNTLLDATFDLTVQEGYIVTIEVWGGGGGGGIGNGTGARGGGGGGAYARSELVALTPGIYAVLVGAGGEAGTPGGKSVFQGVIPIDAGGGSSTNNTFGGAGGTTSSGATANYAGGKGGDAISSDGGGGGGGGSAFPNMAGNPGADGEATTGGAGGTGSGNGGTGSDKGVNNATAGMSPGGGGGSRDLVGPTGAGAGGRIIVTATMALPVELLSFTARPDGGAVRLDWATATEQDNEKFLIERSTDGRAFIAIGEQRGVGTTETKQTYRFLDESPARGVNYYRLKQMDYDGAFEYSPVVAALFAARGKVTMYPTRTAGPLTIVTGEATPTTVRVFNLSGVLVRQQTFGQSEQLQLDLAPLPNGTYIVTVRQGGELFQERVLKY